MKKDTATSLIQHYEATYERFGFNSKGADWLDEEKHVARLDSMLQVIGDERIRGSTFVDVGCGYGRLVDLLQKKQLFDIQQYRGFDPSVKAIEFARSKYPKANFFVADIMNSLELKEADLVFCCGIFTKRASVSENEMYELLEYLFMLCREANVSTLCFNTMSPFCDFQAEDLFYPNISRVYQMINAYFGYQVSNFVASNSHLRYEFIIKFDIANA